MGKPLAFRNRAHSTTVYAKRNKVEYEVCYSLWHEGKETDLRYHVTRRDLVNIDFINTVNVRRFATADEAKQFCQDMCDGKVDLSALRAEINKYLSDKQQKDSDANQAEAQRVKAILSEKGMSLVDFFEVIKIWSGISDSGRSILYKEAEEQQSN